jgi:hypothetical protein
MRTAVAWPLRDGKAAWHKKTKAEHSYRGKKSPCCENQSLPSLPSLLCTGNASEWKDRLAER